MKAAAEEKIETTETAVETEEKRYKYVINGKTSYYTREEIKENARQRQINSGVIPPGDLDYAADWEINNVLKYDGDPYGYATGKKHKLLHKTHASGREIVFF